VTARTVNVERVVSIPRQAVQKQIKTRPVQKVASSLAFCCLLPIFSPAAPPLAHPEHAASSACEEEEGEGEGEREREVEGEGRSFIKQALNPSRGQKQMNQVLWSR